MDNFEKFNIIVSSLLKICFFGLMCLGLILATGLLMFDKIDGAQWLWLCGTLFVSDRFGVAVSEFKK
jgi:hypothetical protein